MIKAVGRAGDRPLIIIGLSDENLRRLRDDQPIRFDLADLGLPPALVLILGGPTEDAIVDQLHENGLLP